ESSIMASILRFLRVKGDDRHGYETTKWINPDIAPLPPHRRTWGYLAFLGFGSIANLCITAWTGGSSLLSLGLTVRHTIGVMFVSKVLMTLLVIGNGWMGAEWHIGFTVSQRMVLGMNGAYIGQLIRIILSIVWYGSQAWLGGLCVSAMLSSWSYSFLTMPNTLPESAKMVTRELIGFLIFQIISIPALLIRVERVALPVTIANIITFFVMMGITIWACTTAGGPGPMFTEGTTQPATLPLGWAWVYGIVASVGGISAGILNQSDFTRFAKKQGSQIPGLIFAIFVPGTIVPIFGILTASATMAIYGEAFWNPLVLIHQWMIDSYDAKSRAAAFFCSLGFVISQLAENTLGNGYAAGMDLAGLFPSWITIKRGGVMCALLSWVVQPWLFYNTSSVFVVVMASFSVFMGPLTAIMIVDYFVIRKQRVQLSQLYSGSPEGSYWFTGGFNWRSLFAWVVGFVPGMPGMIASANPNIHVSKAAHEYYLGNYLFGFCISGCLYYILCLIFKVEGAGLQDETDIYGTFSPEVAMSKGISPFEPNKVPEDAGSGVHIREAADLEAEAAPKP
ncbi:unnamed protein product, partial [Clonostachys byssicola]